jgi:hypothetical protein
MDILWSCLFTIIACTYSVLHLNIPEQRLDRDPGRMGDIKWILKRTGNGLKWMLITIIAPELPLGKYWGDLWEAKGNLARFQELAAEDGVPWTLTHSLFAGMGGFVIRWTETKNEVLVGDPDVTPFGKPTRPKKARSLPDLHTLGSSTCVGNTSSPFDPSVQFEEQETDVPRLVELDGAGSDYPFMHLLGADIIELREAGLIMRLPYVTKEEMDDKSKGDIFVRLIAVSQIGWMVIQIIARAVRGLAVSQLEIAVVAFAACAIFMYVLNWNKPKGVQVPYKLSQQRQKVPQSVVHSIHARREYGGFVRAISGSFANMFSLFVTNINEQQSKAVPDSFCHDGQDWRDSGWGGLLCLTLFGALHISAWSFDFPTRVEMLLWRVASMWCASFTIYCCCLIFLYKLDSEWSSVILASVVIVVSLLSYPLARVFLLVEIFRSLCFLPPTAYVGTWASNVPHIS